MTAKSEGKASAWNSLEICKLASTVLTPMAVLLLGCVIWSGQCEIVQHWERDQIEQRKVADGDARERERLRDVRFSIHREVAPLLNDIFSYHFYVGAWKELSPADIIAKKRKLDSLMYSNMPLFMPGFFKLYHTVMAQSFRSAGNHLGETRIRSDIECRIPHLDNASERWRNYFTHEDNRPSICLAYTTLFGRMSEELLLLSLLGISEAGSEQHSACPNLYDINRCSCGAIKFAHLYQNRYKRTAK